MAESHTKKYKEDDLIATNYTGNLKFWFSTDPNIPIPARNAYEIKKKHGQIHSDMTYEEFLKNYKDNIVDYSE